MNKNMNILKVAITSVLSFILIIGVTYALIKFNFVGNKDNTILVGGLKFNYNETSSSITITEDDILSNTDGMKSDNYFDFNVSLEKQTTTGVSYNILLTSDNTNNLSDIKAYLTEVNNNTETKLIDPITLNNLTKVNNNMILYKDKIFPNETKYYRLRLWVDENFENSQTTSVNGNISTGTITGFTFKFVVSIGVDNTNVEKPTGADTLIALTDNVNDSGLYTITRVADSTLQIGTNESVTEYRYRGASPKNYVTFNNEVWRIIGVFKADDGTGNIENRIKLIRNESIGAEYWDTGNSNNWARPATLNTELNTTYLNSLTSETQSMIGNAKYYLGGYENTSITSVQMYSYERKIQNTTSNEFYYGSNSNSWAGKLALMYVSDYGYSSSNCENEMLYSSSVNDLRACNSTNWLYKGIDEWLLPHHTGGSYFVFYVSSSGIVNGSNVSYYQFGVRPVLYLTSSVKITGGDGTSSSPYTLGL